MADTNPWANGIPTVTVPGFPGSGPGIDNWLETAPPGAPFFSPSPTMTAFVSACSGGKNEPLRMLMLQGPRGEGKTTTGIYACMALADRLIFEGKQNLLPLRVAVVRDTWTNLERTTLVSFEENANKGSFELIWKEGKKEAIIPPFCHFYFFGLDNRKDVDKLQGFQCGLLWLEEVAPAAELATGIPAETLGVGITSIRQNGVPKRVIVTFNPPDEDHWILNVEKVLKESGNSDVIVEKFVIQAGEKSEHFRNLALAQARAGHTALAREWDKAAKEFDAYRRRNKLLLDAIGRWDLVARLVEGKVGGVAMGESLVPFFSMDLHVQDINKDGYILPIQGLPIVRAWDGGLTPSTVWMQFPSGGGVNILGSRTSINSGMAEHIEGQVYDFQRKFKILPRRDMTHDAGTADRMVDSSSGEHRDFTAGGWKKGATGNFDFEDIGDPALWQGNQQTKSEESAAYIIQNLLGTNLTPGPVAWGSRREALLLAFRRTLPGVKGKGGRPFVRMNPKEPAGTTGVLHNDNSLLIKALNGRAHYPVDPDTGRIIDTVAALKKASHVYFQALDALGYALAVKAPAEAYGKPAPVRRRPQDIPPPARSWMGM